MVNKKKQRKIENTKHMIIKNVMDNFSNFKVFLKQMANNKKVMQTFPKLNNIINLNKEELKNELNKSSNSDYEKMMTAVHKDKIMKGGRIIAPTNIESMCSNNITPNGKYQDPATWEDLGFSVEEDEDGQLIDDRIRRILKDDVDDNGKEYPNAYCYNESTICDGAKIRNQMNSDPITRRSWSTAFRQDLGCAYVPPEDEDTTANAFQRMHLRRGRFRWDGPRDGIQVLVQDDQDDYPDPHRALRAALASICEDFPEAVVHLAAATAALAVGFHIIAQYFGGRRKRRKTRKHKKKRRKSTRKHKKRRKRRRRTRKK